MRTETKQQGADRGLQGCTAPGRRQMACPASDLLVLVSHALAHFLRQQGHPFGDKVLMGWMVQQQE